MENVTTGLNMTLEACYELGKQGYAFIVNDGMVVDVVVEKDGHCKQSIKGGALCRTQT